MRSAPPRVAYLPDTFYEINGVAHTSRHFEAFAQRRGLPFFCLHPGKEGSAIREQHQDELTTLDIPRGSAISFRIEKDLTFDAAFIRHKKFLEDHLRAFRPDIVHVTGPANRAFWERGWPRILRFRWLPPGTPTCMNMRRSVRLG